MIFGAITGLDFGMAVTIFSNFRSTQSQKKVLIETALASTRCSDEFNAELKTVLNSYLAIADKRNEVAHKPLGWETGKTSAYIMTKQKVRKPGTFPYSKRDITVDELNQLSNQIKALSSQIIGLADNTKPKLSMLIDDKPKTKLKPRGLLSGEC